jgi:multidrug efflux pump subunit AcrA (membrane-fusion protein)
MLRHRLCVKAFLCLVLLTAGCGRAEDVPVTSTPASTPGTTGLTYVVQRGKVTRELEFTGRISPVEEVSLYFKTAGYVKEVFVQPGDQVQAGDLLAELEVELGIDSLQNQISAAELNLALAEARLTQAEDANAYAIAQAEMALVLAQEELSRTQSLRATYTAGTVSARVDLKRAETGVTRAEVEYQEALDRYWEPDDVRESYALALQLARWNLEAAQARYNQAIANEGVYQRELRIAEITVSQAEVELEQLKQGVSPVLAIEVEQAQQLLGRLKESARIIAPVDGEVVSLSLYPGCPVEPFQTVIVIADPATVEVSADLSDDQLRDVTEGQKVAVALSVNSDRSWTGTIRRLPYPYGTGGGSAILAGAGSSTRISLEGDLSELKLGDLVQVTIVLEEKDDVLWLPPNAIQTLQDRVFVTVQEDERQRRIDVVLGIEGRDRVEILEGLREGQEVIGP